MEPTRKHRSPKPRLGGVAHSVKDKLRDGETRSLHTPTVFARLHALFPRHASNVNDPPPENKAVEEKQEAPYEHALKVRIISWNMNDTLPKGDLAALLGVVPPYVGPEGTNPAASDFQFTDAGHPYHIIVVAGQECPTGLLPMGMGAVKMDRKDKDKSKSKKEKDYEDPSSNKSKVNKPRRSDEEEYQPLTDTPTVTVPPGTPQPHSNVSLPIHTPGSSQTAQHSSGWSALLEDWFSKGLGARHIILDDILPSSPVFGNVNGIIPPSPSPSRSPPLPPLPPAPLVDPARLSVPPSPRRMNTFIGAHGHGHSHSNGHNAWNDTMGPGAGPYVLVAKERLMGIYLAVYVHRETRPLIRGVSRSSVTAGLIGGRLGNKGGVGISMNVAGRSFLFVNAHLAAHEGRQAMRIENMEKIQAELRVDNFGEPLYARKPLPDPTKSDITDSFDYTFVFGDLNFRLDVSRLHADWLISRQDYLRAQEFDELRNNMRSNKLFPGFEEPAIDFPPTFKYDVPKSRHHHSRRDKDGREKDRGVRASIRAARRSRRKKDKERDQDKMSKSPSTNSKALRPLAEQVESAGSSSDLDQDHDAEDDSDADSLTSSHRSRPHSQSQPNLNNRSRAPGSTHSQPLSTPTLRGSSLDEDSSEDGEEAVFVSRNTELNAAPTHTGLARILSQGAKKGWKVLVVKSGAEKDKERLGKRKGDVDRKRGTSFGPEVVAGGFGSPITGGIEMAKSQPNLVIDTTDNSRLPLGRTSMDAGGGGGMLSPAGLAPPPLIRANSSTKSVTEDGEDQHGKDTKGVYDTSSKQRVPSWCDRILYKSTVLPPHLPPSLTLSAFPPPLLEEDSRFGRVGNIFTGLRRKGSRGRKDSLPLAIPRIKEPGPMRKREALLAETRASPFLKRQGENIEDNISEERAVSVERSTASTRPGSSGRNGGGGAGVGKRPDSRERRPGSSGTGGDQPASLQWPRTNPFARLLHPHLHGSAQGPGLIHATSMEPTPQPPSGLGLSPDATPRPRSLSASEGRAGSLPLPEPQDLPAPPSKDDNPRWRFFRPFTRDSIAPVIAEPEPEPEPESDERRRGDIVCVSYGTLDDKAMQKLGGRSDHRPVIGTYAVYI